MKKFTKFVFGIVFAMFTLISTGLGLVFSNNYASAAEPEYYTVTFNLNGGNVGGSTVPITYYTNAEGRLVDAPGSSTLITELPTPTYGSYVFAGWFMGEGASKTAVNATTIFSADTEVKAWWSTKMYSYTVSSYVDGDYTYFSVFGLKANGDQYEVALALETVAEAFDAIALDTDLNEQTIVNLNTINLQQNETIDLTQKNILITGAIASNFDSPIFNINPQSLGQSITFDELTISNGSTDVLISTTPSAYTSTIEIKNSVFTSSSERGYALYFTSSNYTVKLSENNSHTTKYLFNYFNGLSIDATEKLTNAADEPLVVELEYFHDEVLIASNVYSTDKGSNSGKIIFDNDSVAYTVVNSPSIAPTGITFYGDIQINFEFDLNGGSYITTDNLPVFNYKSNKAFSTSNNLTKTYHTFDAWFGKFEVSEAQKTAWGLSATTYYYDTEILAAFKQTNYDVTQIETLFKTTLNDFDSTNAFSKYAYDETATSTDYLTFEMAETLQIVPKFIARWSAINYTISFETNEGSSVNPIVKPFGETITSPVTTKTGYIFLGWFENLQTDTAYTFSTMPAKNFTLYARWQIGTFTVTFISEGTTIGSVTQEYLTPVDKPAVSKTGHKIAGWFTEETFVNEFDFKTPAVNTNVYVKWEKETYRVFFWTNPDNKPELSVAPFVKPYLYQDSVAAPTTPTAEGFDFINWFVSTNSQTVVEFPFNITGNVSVYARWRIKQYTITYNSNGGSLVEATKYDYAEAVTAPYVPYKKGFSFEGWFIDSELQTPFTFTESTTMPAQDFTLYAKWAPKSIISLNQGKQSCVVDDIKNYSVDSTIKGFAIEYKVNGKWVKNTPKEVGVYDIRITRAEDNSYAEFVYEIEDGYEIIQKTLDITWLIILLSALLVLEIIGLVFIKHLQKVKKSPITTFALTLPMGIITTNQLVISIVLAALVVVSLILIIYELVKLHRISTEEIKEPSIYNTRNTIEKMEDKSEDSKIAIKVDDLLQKEGLIEVPKDDEPEIKETGDEN